MSSVKDYFTGLGKGMVSLLKGMEVTGKEFVTKKVTEEYPDNRDNLPVGERFRGTLELIYDEKGNHKCIACGLCQMNCPNQTIHIESKMVELPDGKKKKSIGEIFVRPWQLYVLPDVCFGMSAPRNPLHQQV